MTKQEIFNIAAGGLLKQNKYSTDVMGQCAYRGIGNLKCAVGFLIPDDKYAPAMERYSILTIPDLFGLEHLKGHESFLVELQKIHDECPVSEWNEELRLLAQRHTLSTEVLDKLNKEEQ